MMGNYHVRFWNGGGAVARSTDRSAADRLIEVAIVVDPVFEGVFFSFIRRFTRRRLMRGPLAKNQIAVSLFN
jgi:hypothetical protein